MAILDSSLAPYLIILALVVVLFTVFRHLISKVFSLLLIELALFIIFPKLLIQFVDLVSYIRHLFRS